MTKFKHFLRTSDDVPEDLLLRAEANMLKQNRKRIKNLRRYNKKIKKIRDSIDNKVEKIIGPRKAKRLAAFRKTHRKELSKAQERLKRDFNYFEKYEKKRNQLLDKSREFVERLDVDIEKLNFLTLNIYKQIDQTYTKYIDPKYQVGQVITHDPDTTQSYVAPFVPVPLWLLGSLTSGFTEQHVVPNPLPNGQLRTSTNVGIYDKIGDCEKGVMNFRTGYIIWYQMPLKGSLAMEIDYKVNRIISNGVISEEWTPWGDAADANVRQSTDAYVQVVSHNILFAYDRLQLDSVGGGFYAKGENVGPWAFDHQNYPIDTRVNLGPLGPFEVGEWVGIHVGLETKNVIFSNDCRVQSNLGIDLNIIEIRVSATSPD